VTTTAPITLSGDVYQSDGSFYGSDHDLQIEGALTLADGAFHAPTSFDLTGVFSHTGGTYYQTRSVTGGGDVGFPKAGGVILNANGQDLGVTQVALTAGELCTGTSAGNAVEHCYVITPTNATGRDATVTFYYRDDELPPGHACSVMQAHRWDGSWDHVLTRDAAYGSDGRMCGGDPQSIRVTNVTTFSPFALRGPLFNFTVQPDHLIANGADESELTVSVPPFFAGRVVTFTWNMGYFPSPVTDTVNASGVASYTYAAGNTPGTDVITATVHDEGVTKIATATIQLDSSPLLGNLSSAFRGKLITYTFVVTNVGIVADTNVVMTGSIPANTELVWVDNGILVPTGGDYGWGYVATITYPNMAPDEVHVLAWSVRTLLMTGDILTQAHARSDQNILRLPLRDRVYRILFSLVFLNAEF
jgi:uncharacterized repeat protein (TIGR01451 family)